MSIDKYIYIEEKKIRKVNNFDGFNFDNFTSTQEGESTVLVIVSSGSPAAGVRNTKVGLLLPSRRSRTGRERRYSYSVSL